MKNDIKPASVVYEHRGYESVIELNWTIAGLLGPDQIIIAITRLGRPEHTMTLSSNYGSIEEAITAAEGLVRHYTSVVSP